VDDPAMPAPDFLLRPVPALRKTVFRLGLSGSFGLDEAGFREGLEQVQYVFLSKRMPLRPLREALARDRERYVVAAGPMVGWFPGVCRRAVEQVLRKLHTDYLDVLQLYWLGKMSAFTGAVQEEMVRLREEGKVRALGTSIHDRPRAGRLAQDSILDLLMLRYNAAHPGAEQDVFPRLASRRPAVVAYTATSWRRLLRAPRGWTGRVPTAGDCYRFCLTSPHVDVVLTGPSDVAQLRENLAAVARGPLDAGELEWMRAFGRAVHG
jgi:aryl-alcohol dehydrogenase-like predicted oxidoreductase